MGKSIRKNYLYNTSYQVFTLITPFIVTPYLSRVLEPSGVGIYSYSASIVAYFVLFAQLGTATYAQREIAYCHTNKEKVNRTFWEQFLLRLILAVASMTIYVITMKVLDIDSLIYILQSLNIIAVALDVNWLFYGLEDFKKITIRNFLVRCINVVFVFLFVKQSDDVWKYVLIMSGINIIGNMTMWRYAYKIANKPQWSEVKPFRNITAVLQIFIPTIAINIYTVLDKTMLGMMGAGMDEVGFYEQSEKICKMPIAIITSLGTVLMPRMAYDFSSGNIEKLHRNLKKAINVTWMISVPICFGLAGISDNFVPWFFGPGYDKVVLLIHIMCFITIAIGFSTLFGNQYMVVIKKQNQFTICTVIGAVVNFVLNLLCVPMFSSAGTAIATLISEVAVTGGQLYMLRRDVSYKDFFCGGEKYIFLGVLMYIMLSFMSAYMESSLINTLILIVLSVIFYIGLLYKTNDRLLLELMKR